DQDEALAVIGDVARALVDAHTRGIVHRDVKPENILIDQGQCPYLIDFGLGQVKEHFNGGEKLRVGTPPYISPEQASGTAHRISNRSDVFALGVILYEILTGNVPFSRDRDEMLREIIHGEVVPPSSLVENIPKALEELCLAALSRLPTARPSADDFAKTLEAQVFESESGQDREARYRNALPKGLHSFDEEDSDFFLDLLPGPEGENGLPASVSLWKSRIESAAGEKSFRLALLFGPSGSGKSSFLRSGLLPQLSSSVIPVFVEASTDTEFSLIEALRHRFPRLEDETDLVSLLKRILAGEGVPVGGRLLIVVDQFEQHLHRVDPESDALSAAFEVIDGERVKVLLSVRDDFWISATQFFSGLSIDLDTGRNAGAVDLFDKKHARDVLIRFGRGINSLPAFPAELERAQKRFVRTVIREIAVDGRVSPVQLSLIVEKFRDRPWEVAEWDRVGGISGIGVSYVKSCFEKHFSDEQRPVMVEASHRIFRELIPEDASKIKGESRSRSELRELVSSLGVVVEFDQLIYLLVRTFRLLSPSQAIGKTEEGHYNLSHDYLVPVLRNWIDEEKQRTKQGRAQLLLRDRAKIWKLDGTWRSLPSFAEWCRIVFFARSSEWNDSECSMMKRTSIRETIRVSLCVICGSILLIWAINASQSRLASRLYSDLKSRGMESFDSLQPKFQDLRKKIVPILEKSIEDSDGVSANVVFSQRVLYRMGQLDAVSHVESVLALEPRELRSGIQSMGAFDGKCIEVLNSIASDNSQPERAFRSKVLLALTSEELVDVDALVEEWVLRDIDEVANWADAILSIGKSARDAAEKRYRLPKGYRPDKEYSFVVSARESAKVAVAFASVGETEKVRQSLASKNRIEQRTHLINFLKPDVVGRYDLWTTPVENRQNPHLISGLLQAIGEVSWDEIPDGKKPALVANVHTAFASSNAEVHFSAKFAMRRWKLKQPEFTTQIRIGEGSWFLSASGISFAVFPGEDGRVMAVAATEVTAEQYFRIMPPNFSDRGRGTVEGFEDSPMPFTSLQEVFRFCNVLSEREGLDQCFEVKNGNLRPYPDIDERTGYRIPTVSEWELACGGGSQLRFSFGSRIDSLQWHAWVRENTDGQSRRVGLTRPNPFGMSDMLGNLSEWVYEFRTGDHSKGNPQYWQVGGDYLISETDFAEGIPRKQFDHGGNGAFGGVRLVRTLALD
ncbi:MAG: SUMF1/EgtB/PvdO family nonheme iron enzyme, partial [Verrucomicrobiales bacterium]|nr:SUMF1/EgtB/PvdO family nonheme iron enzyme [Verrucomicrobiales bacterium]